MININIISSLGPPAGLAFTYSNKSKLWSPLSWSTTITPCYITPINFVRKLAILLSTWLSMCFNRLKASSWTCQKFIDFSQCRTDPRLHNHHLIVSSPPPHQQYDNNNNLMANKATKTTLQQQPHGQQTNKENKNNTTTATKTTSLTWWQHYLLPGSLIGFEGRIWQQVDPGVNIAISIPEPNIIDNDDDDNDKMIEDYDHVITMHDNCRCSKPAHLKNQAIATLATHEFRCSSKFYNPTKVRDEIY